MPGLKGAHKQLCIIVSQASYLFSAKHCLLSKCISSILYKKINQSFHLKLSENTEITFWNCNETQVFKSAVLYIYILIPTYLKFLHTCYCAELFTKKKKILKWF